jgi:hypothetical protein
MVQPLKIKKALRETAGLFLLMAIHKQGDIEFCNRQIKTTPYGLPFQQAVFFEHGA